MYTVSCEITQKVTCFAAWQTSGTSSSGKQHLHWSTPAMITAYLGFIRTSKVSKTMGSASPWSQLLKHVARIARQKSNETQIQALEILLHMCMLDSLSTMRTL